MFRFGDARDGLIDSVKGLDAETVFLEHLRDRVPCGPRCLNEPYLTEHDASVRQTALTEDDLYEARSLQSLGDGSASRCPTSSPKPVRRGSPGRYVGRLTEAAVHEDRDRVRSCRVPAQAGGAGAVEGA